MHLFTCLIVNETLFGRLSLSCTVGFVIQYLLKDRNVFWVLFHPSKITIQFKFFVMIWMLKTVNWKVWSEIVQSLVASLWWIFRFRLCHVVDGPRYSKNDIRILAFKRTTSDTGEEHLMGSYVLGVSPSLIWSHTISTYWSRSGRLCSCQNPVMKSSKWIEFLYEAPLKYRLNIETRWNR